MTIWTDGGNTNSDVTEHTVNLPDGSNVSGRRIILFFTSDGSGETFTPPDASWIRVFSEDGTGFTHACFYHECDGTEGWSGTDDTITMTVSSVEQSAHCTFLLSSDEFDSSKAPEVSTVAEGTSTAPDPGLLSPSWGSANNIWYVYCVGNGASSTEPRVTGYPTNYSANGVEWRSAGPNGIATGVSYRKATASSEDPDAFTLSSSVSWLAITVAVKPGGGIQITTAEGTQSQSSDAAILTIIIAPAENTQSQTSDAAVVTPASQSIEIAEATQSQTSDAAITASIYITAPAENTQAQTSDAAVITAIHVVVPAEATQAQVSDAAITTAVYLVSTAEATQAQTSDAAELGQYITIDAAEATQAQTSDAAILAVIHGITPAEATQGQSSDKASISVLGATRWTTYWTTLFDQDQEAFVTLANIAGTIRLWGRMVNPTGGGVDLRGYFAQYAGGTVEAHRYNDATSTDEGLGTASVSLSNGDKLWLRLEGDQVSVYTYQSGAWSQQISVTDGSPALEDGYIGIDATDASAILDDFSGGSLSVDLTTAEATQTQISDAAELSFFIGVTPAESTQTQVSDAAALTAITAIQPAEATQTQTSDAASLTGATSIDPAENTQAQTSDAAAISIIHLLSTAEGTQAQVSDAASVSFEALPAVNITPAENTQTQTSDAASLTAITAILPAESTQTQTSDAATLTGATTITTAEGTQAQVSDAATLSYIFPTYTIEFSESTQTQSSDAAGIGVYYVLSVADATQAQTSDAVSISIPPSGPGERTSRVFGTRGSSALDTRANQGLEVRADSVFATRQAHELATRSDLEVDD